MMKRIIIAFICLICLAISTAFATEYKSYHSVSSDFNIDVPTDFQYFETQPGKIQMTAGNQKLGILMTVRVNEVRNSANQVEREAQLKAAMPALVNRLKSQGATMQNSGAMTVSGHPAIYFNYTINRVGEERYQEQYMILGKDNLYSVVFTSPAATATQNKPLFAHAIASMTIR